MKRRSAMIVGVAAAAGAAGLGGALWRTRAVTANRGAAVWQMRFDTPQGASLELARFRGKPLLLNFWATWCPPCVSEMPRLDRFQQDHRAGGWQVVGLAVDKREPVVEFLRRTPVSYAIGLAGMGGVELSHAMGNTAGALPFSVVFDRSGQAVDHKLGIVESADLARWVASVG